jgi:GLTT repeat (6 copies)
MSAVAALAVASPAAVVALSDLSASTNPPTQHRKFVEAAMITDLPNELMSALSQGLSQFGINLPPMPTSLLTGSGSSTPGLTAPSLTPGLTAPGLTPGLTAPGLTTPGAGLSPLTGAGPALTDPALTNPALTSPALTSPAGQLPGLTTPGLPTAGLTTPGLTTPGLTTPGLTTPAAGVNPALASPISNAAALPAPNEVPIGLDPAAGTYPIVGDPSLGGAPATGGSGGIFGDLSSMASQLGAGQAIDLLKGMVMPAIMSAVKPAGAPAAAAALPAAAAALPAAAAALPAAAPAIPGL